MNDFMSGLTVRISTVLLASALSTLAAEQPPQELSLSAWEQRLKQIDAQLAQLASYSLASGIGAIGFRSYPHDREDHPEWIEVNLGQTYPLDEVVLVPAIRRDALSEFQADGFPKALRLVAGTGEDREGKVIAEYASDAGFLPRIAPLVIPCRGTVASWIRIEARTLSRRGFDEKYVFQLSEILAFSGPENVALHKPVKSSADNIPELAPGWADAYVVDGFLPYLMAAAHGKKSVAYVNPGELGNNPFLAMDLGDSLPLSGINLHAVDQSDTVPQAFAGDFGVPQVLHIEGANVPDFSDARVLIEFHHGTIYDVGPIMMWTFTETNCRYVRLEVVEPHANSLYGQIPERLGFAEIEILSGGRNVALHKPVTASFKSDDPIRRLSSLTDGLNFYGMILPVRDWLNQLAQRHELEKERPSVVAELNQHYARQKITLNRLIWLTALLAAAVIIVFLLDRRARQRAIENIRKRFAADLHDELGADLHAISLLSDLARAARQNPEKLDDFLGRIRALSAHTGKAARHYVNLLEAEEHYGDLVADMRRAANRILTDMQHTMDFEGDDALSALTPQEGLDLLLFYQEALANIIRHSGATCAHTRLSAANREICLTVSDDGRGLPAGAIPPSLKRRARLLGAELEGGKSDLNGARIQLRLKTRRFKLFNFLK